MIDPVQRLVFRGQAHPDAILADLRPALEQRVAADQILTASLFRWRDAAATLRKLAGPADFDPEADSLPEA